MRTKSRGGIVTKTVPAWHRDYNWSPTTKTWVPLPIVTYTNTLHNGKIETITYDDSKRTGQFKRTRWCLHTTEEHSDWQETHSYYNSTMLNKRRDYLSGGSYVPGPLTIPDLASIHLEALDFFKSGCVEKKFDLAVDLLEWRQVTTLLPSISDSIFKLKNVYLGYKFKKTDFKMTLKSLSNLHLSYAFGVKPLVSDIMDLIEAVSALSEKVAWLRKNQGKPVKVSFSKDLSTVYRPTDVLSSDEWSVSQNKVLEYRFDYRAYALIQYNIGALNDLELRLRVLTRSMGLDKPVTWLYEMIPFSFVLDWVLRVGDLLENLSPSISLPYEFLDVGYTVKIIETRITEKIRKLPYKGDSYHLYGRLKRTLFFREPGLPTSFSTISGDPGLRQLALALSLSIQRWK